MINIGITFGRAFREIFYLDGYQDIFRNRSRVAESEV